METLKKNKFLILFVVILIGVSFIFLYLKKDNEEDYYEKGEDITLKKYAENEYIPVNISYDQIAKIYLQDYVYKLLHDREDAYNTLDEEYRKVKFPTFEDFNEYIDIILTTKTREMKVTSYAVSDGIGYRDFDVYDSGNKLFIFREKGVMQYTVYFDRYTVNMK